MPQLVNSVIINTGAGKENSIKPGLVEAQRIIKNDGTQSKNQSMVKEAALGAITYYQDWVESQEEAEKLKKVVDVLEKELDIKMDGRKARRPEVRRMKSGNSEDSFPYYQQYLDSEKVRVGLKARVKELEKEKAARSVSNS